MKHIAQLLLLPALPALWLLAGCSHVAHEPASDPSLQIGAAEVDITPPIGYRMAGYFNERFSTAIHDPLHAKAIVLRQGTEQLALVSCDLVGVPLDVSTNARARASQRTGIPVPNIVICATHTHTGPLYEGPLREYLHAAALEQTGADPHESLDYAAFLTDQLVNVLAAAQASLRPAQLQAGVAQEEGLSFNRRFWMKNGKVAFNPGQRNPNIVRPAGPVDPDVGILLARAPDAPQPFAGLTVFAVHPDSVGGTEYSADYAFFLEQTLHRAFGPHYLSALGLGTCGDINHINVKEAPAARPKFEATERIGNTLGQLVAEQSKSLPPIARPALAARSTTLPVPFQEVAPEQVAAARQTMLKFHDPATPFLTLVAAVRTLDLARLGPSRPMEVQAFRLDADTAIVCLPCEIFVEIGLAIKQASPFKQTMVISICNDRPSYVPTLKAFSEGSYEVTNARVKPGADKLLIDASLSLLRQLKPQ